MASIPLTLQRWLTRHQRHPQARAVLDRRQIFILPTRMGYVLLLVLLAMLLAALNYNNNLAFLFTFLIGAIALNAMWFTYRQLSGLVIEALPQDNNFLGHSTEIRMLLHHPGNTTRYGILLFDANKTQLRVYDCPANERIIIQLPVTPQQRGVYHLDKFVLATRAPLGLFHAWSWQQLDITIWIYPQPLENHSPPFSSMQGTSTSPQQSAGEGDDFDSLREYHLGDTPSRIAWKKQARNEDWLVKDFRSPQSGGEILDYDALPPGHLEQKLSQLCYWVVRCEQQHQLYGLKLPGVSIHPGNGNDHYHRCLLALAQFQSPAS